VPSTPSKRTRRRTCTFSPDLRDQRLAGGIDRGRRIIDERLLQEGRGIRGIGVQGRLGHGLCEGREAGILGHEIGLTVDLDHHAALAISGQLDDHHALGRDPSGFLRRLGLAGFAHGLDSGLDIPSGLGKGLLALHHARAGALAELFHGCRSDRHA
jgi:hypothetical protein